MLIWNINDVNEELEGVKEFYAKITTFTYKANKKMKEIDNE